MEFEKEPFREKTKKNYYIKIYNMLTALGGRVPKSTLGLSDSLERLTRLRKSYYTDGYGYCSERCQFKPAQGKAQG